MKFSTQETIGTDDTALVLAALERSVGAISLNVIRMGEELQAYGIGPSPRPSNARNLTVFRVEVEGPGRTRVEVDSEFLASSLLDASAQEPAVRAKVERALELARDEVAHHRWLVSKAAAAGETATASHRPLAVGTATRTSTEAPPPMTPRQPLSASVEAPFPAAARAPLVQSVPPVPDRSYGGPPSRQPEMRVEQPPVAPSQHGTARTPEASAGTVAVAPVAVEAVHTAPPQVAEARGMDARAPAKPGLPSAAARTPVWAPGRADSPASRRQRPSRTSRALPISILVLLLVALAYMVGRWQAGVQQAPLPEDDAQFSLPARDLRQVPARPSQELHEPAAARHQPPRPAASIPVDTRTTNVPAASGAGGSNGPVPQGLPAGLQGRLEQWAAAMKGNDAAAQAAFYASHLDRYFLRTDVGHDVVLRDKQDYLRRGHRVDQFDLEDVRIEDETASTVGLRLIKHYVMQASAGAPHVEHRVRSELDLRRIEGVWKITGERDFR